MEKLCAKMLHAAFYKISQRLSKNSKAIDCDCLGKIKTKCVKNLVRAINEDLLCRGSDSFISEKTMQIDLIDLRFTRNLLEKDF